MSRMWGPHIRKNGKRKGKQNHICVACGRQFIDAYEPYRGYSGKVIRECLKMYTNGLEFRAIERVKGVHHTTVITWVKQVGERLPDAYDPDTTPEVGERDERQAIAALHCIMDIGEEAIAQTTNRR